MGGWYLVYNSLPFGWKISPYIYQSTGLVATSYFRSIGIPCSLYIDDRHTGQLQVDTDKGAYPQLVTRNERNLAAANSAIFLVAYHLISLGYFLGLAKSILSPNQVVPYLGFMVDSNQQAFKLIPSKKEKFVTLIREMLSQSTASVKSLQRLVGKCVSFSLAVPGALLFTKEMNSAIARCLRNHRRVRIEGRLREEIAHWLFLESWDGPFPWRDERHLNIQLSSDAAGSGWGVVLGKENPVTFSDYWTDEERKYDIAVREALALVKGIASLREHVKNARVDAQVDNMAVVYAWEKQGCRNIHLSRAIKQLFFETARWNVLLRVSYVASEDNPADSPSRRLSKLDSKLHPDLWSIVQEEFGGASGHTCDLMALDSNTMTDLEGHPLPHFTPFPSPESKGVNLFCQDIGTLKKFLTRPYVFPPMALTGPVVSFLKENNRACTLLVLVTYPYKYWWPLVLHYATRSLKLASRGDRDALLVLSKDGWTPHGGIPGDLWAFALTFE